MKAVLLPIVLAVVFCSAAFAQVNEGIEAVKRQDYAVAFRAFSTAAEAGHPQAQLNLGVLYLSGQGTLQSDRLAFEWIQRAAAQRYTPAQRQLGILYNKGHGVQRNDLSAKEWLLKAANKGDPRAQFALGRLFEEGLDIRFDDPRAKDIVAQIKKDGAALPHSDTFSLKDPYEAMRWYEKAVERGHKAAHVNLGNMLREPDSAYQDYGRAMRLYEVVANAREATLQDREDIAVAVFARYNIAIMYERGQRVLPNPARAKEWRCKAVAIGRRLPELPLFLVGYARECPAVD